MGNIRLIDTADVYNSCSYHFTAKVACEAAAQLPAGHHATGDVITAFWSYKQQLTRWLTRPNKSEWMVSYKRWIRHTSEFLPKTVIGLAINKDYKGGKRRKVDTVDSSFSLCLDDHTWLDLRFWAKTFRVFAAQNPSGADVMYDRASNKQIFTVTKIQNLHCSSTSPLAKYTESCRLPSQWVTLVLEHVYSRCFLFSHAK